MSEMRLPSFTEWLSGLKPDEGPQMRTFKPSMRERIPMAVQDGLIAVGMKPQKAGTVARRAAEVLDYTPVGSAAEAWDAGADASTRPTAMGKAAALGRGVAAAALVALPGGKRAAKAGKDAIEEIAAYNETIRKPRSVVSLDRNPLFDSNIPYQADNVYRLIGRSGLDDLQQAGKVRAKQDTKMGFDHAFYEQGRANSIYAKNGGGDVAVEVAPNPSQFENLGVQGAYPRAHVGQEVTPNDAMRIWQRNPATGQHEIIFDNIGDAISYARKYGGTPQRSASGAARVVAPNAARAEAESGNNAGHKTFTEFLAQQQPEPDL